MDLNELVSGDNEEDTLPESFWIIDHDELCWAPGVLIKDVSETQMHVQCIVDEEYYAIEKPALKVVKSAMEGREDLLDILKDQYIPVHGLRDSAAVGSILHTLRQRYE